jgi:type IV secretory pathway component VirB8
LVRYVFKRGIVTKLQGRGKENKKNRKNREVYNYMFEVCCLIIFVVIIVIVVLALLPKEHTVKVVQTPSPQIQKVYVKNCSKCGAENEAGNQFCKQCGNRF